MPLLGLAGGSAKIGRARAGAGGGGGGGTFPNLVAAGLSLAQIGGEDAIWSNSSASVVNPNPPWTLNGSTSPVTSYTDTGTITVVSTGYGDAPPAGGPNVIQRAYVLGADGGSGSGRLGVSFAAADHFGFGMLFKLSTDYPWGPGNGGNKVAETISVGGTSDRSYLVFPAKANPEDEPSFVWAVAFQGDWTFDQSATPGFNMTAQAVERDGEWHTLEAEYDYTGGAGNGVMKLFYDGSATPILHLTGGTFPGTGTFTTFYTEWTNNGQGTPQLVVGSSDGEIWEAVNAAYVGA